MRRENAFRQLFEDINHITTYSLITALNVSVQCSQIERMLTTNDWFTVTTFRVDFVPWERDSYDFKLKHSTESQLPNGLWLWEMCVFDCKTQPNNIVRIECFIILFRFNFGRFYLRSIAGHKIEWWDLNERHCTNKASPER